MASESPAKSAPSPEGVRRFLLAPGGAGGGRAPFLGGGGGAGFLGGGGGGAAGGGGGGGPDLVGSVCDDMASPFPAASEPTWVPARAVPSKDEPSKDVFLPRSSFPGFIEEPN